ncbi:MAG: hypothetical protein IPN89_08085 [Saprospiraceae bacterium]|nr:hypothetical protein [Saprospiraceae bacterium]
MKKVFCVGEALIDMICTDKGMTLSEGSHFLKKTGGAPTNVAAAIAALGSQVDLMAKVGNDPFGDQLVAEMNSFGVGTRWMFRDKHRFTTVAYVSLMKMVKEILYLAAGLTNHCANQKWRNLISVRMMSFILVLQAFGRATLENLLFSIGNG